VAKTGKERTVAKTGKERTDALAMTYGVYRYNSHLVVQWIGREALDINYS
jgi:hypothetical protein